MRNSGTGGRASRDDVCMRRAKAAELLRLAAGGFEKLKFVQTLEGDRTELAALYAFGPGLDTPEGADLLDIAVALDLPPDQAPWRCAPLAWRTAAEYLRLDRRAVRLAWRSARIEVANHRIRRPLRFWSAAQGTDENAIAAFAVGNHDQLRAAEPPPALRAERLTEELAVSLAHLRETEARYYDRDWRREHKGDGYHPEHALHDAVSGYLDLLAATQESGPLPVADAANGIQ